MWLVYYRALNWTRIMIDSLSLRHKHTLKCSGRTNDISGHLYPNNFTPKRASRSFGHGTTTRTSSTKCPNQIRTETANHAVRQIKSVWRCLSPWCRSRRHHGDWTRWEAAMIANRYTRSRTERMNNERTYQARSVSRHLYSRPVDRPLRDCEPCNCTLRCPNSVPPLSSTGSAGYDSVLSGRSWNIVIYAGITIKT